MLFMCKNPISEHIFLFPFAWKIKEQSKGYLFKQHKQINEGLFDRLEGWENEYLAIQTDSDYNEFVYFYKPVRAALYTKEEAPVLVLNYKSKLLKQSGEMLLKVGEGCYTLEIVRLSLKIYKSGVGILSIHIKNNQYKSPEDIININSFSKSIYPSVLPIEKSWQDIYPRYVQIKLDESHSIDDHFDKDYKKMPGRITDVIMYVLGNSFTCDREELVENKILIEPVIGSHMITLCLYQNNKMVKDIMMERIDKGFLHTFMLLSKKERHIGKVDYLNTPYRIYGISMFALICIYSKNIESKVYDQLVSLILVQKASLLNFSSQIATISTLPKNELVPAIQSIYEIYIQFINQMYFDEITEDIQGSMIYKMFMNQLNIKEELKQLDFEMKEVHEYAELVDQTQSRIRMDGLTIVGASLVVPTFVTGFFGMNIMEDKFTSWWEHREIALWFNSYVALPILLILSIWIWNRNRGKGSRVIKFVLMLGIVINLLIIFLYGCGLDSLV